MRTAPREGGDRAFGPQLQLVRTIRSSRPEIRVATECYDCHIGKLLIVFCLGTVAGIAEWHRAIAAARVDGLPGCSSSRSTLVWMGARMTKSAKLFLPSVLLWLAPHIAAALPDLVPTALTPAGTLIAGQSVNISFTIANQGDATANPIWSDRVYFSSDAVIGGGDTNVGQDGHFSAVLAGANYSDGFSINVPNVAPGSYFLILRADVDDNVAEQQCQQRLGHRRDGHQTRPRSDRLDAGGNPDRRAAQQRQLHHRQPGRRHGHANLVGPSVPFYRQRDRWRRYQCGADRPLQRRRGGRELQRRVCDQCPQCQPRKLFPHPACRRRRQSARDKRGQQRPGHRRDGHQARLGAEHAEFPVVRSARARGGLDLIHDRQRRRWERRPDLVGPSTFLPTT